MSNDVIPRDALIKLFKDAPKLGVKSLTLTGDGEPTLNPAVYDAMQVGKAGGLDIGFATNGIALDVDKIKALLKYTTWLRFNLSAVSKEGYKSIHGVDQWKSVQAHIKQAVELKRLMGSECTIGVQMVLIPQCIKEVLPEARFAVKNKIDYFVIKQFSDPGCEEMSRFSLRWYDNPEVVKILKTAENMSTQRTKIVPKWELIASKGIRAYDRCVDCSLIFQISGNSRCYPCGYLFNDERYCYGDLKKQSLGQILTSDNYWDVVRYMRDMFNVHKDCKGNCRHDKTNEFVWNYIHPPNHINFI